MATLLKLGANVTGQSSIEKFAEALNEVAQATTNVDVAAKRSNAQIKTIAAAMNGLARDAKAAAGSIQASQAVLAGFKGSLDSIWKGGKLNSGLAEFEKAITVVRTELGLSEKSLTNFITTSGRYAEIAKKNSLASYEVSAGLRAQEQAVSSLLSIEGSYVNALSREALLNNEAAISLRAKTAAVNTNVAAYEKLIAIKAVDAGSYNKTFDYAKQLQSEERLIAARAALASGAGVAKYADQLAKENSEYLTQEASIRRVTAARAALAAGSKAGGYDYAKQLKEEAYLYDTTTGRLKSNISSLDKLGNAFDTAGRKTKSFHDILRGASGAMGTLWLTYGQILPMLAGFATVSAGMKTFSIGSELDYTARSIEILSYGYKTLESNVDLANKSLTQTKEALLGIQGSTFSANELGEGVLEFSRAGYTDLAKNIKGIEAASKFAYIGQMDLAKAVELVVGEMSAFKGITADSALNTMAVVADKTSINLQQMGDAFKNATSLGTVLGLKFNDVATAIGVMGQAGIRGATAGAALNTMMYKLIAPTEKAQKQMDALGISFKAFDSKGSIKSIKDIAYELAEMTKNLKPNEIGAVFESMVGLRGVKALGALVQMAKESTKDFDALSESVQKSGGYLDGHLRLLEKSGKVQSDMLKANFSNIFAAAYTDSEPAIIEALKSLNDLAKDKAVVSFVSSLATGLALTVKMLANGTSAVVDFVAALDSIIPIKAPIEATLSGIANKLEQVAKLAKLAKEGQADGGVSFNPVKSWGEYSKSVENLFSGKSIKDGMAEAALEAAKLANQTANAKAELVAINGVEVKVFSEAEVSKLATIEEYFDGIRDKIIDANKTPLQLIDAKVQQDTQAYLNTIVQGGMSLDQMIELTKNYKEQLDNVGGAGDTAAENIEKIGKSLKDTGGDEGKIKQLIGNLQDLARAANAGEIAKVNKQVIAGLKKDWQSYADKVIDIQEKIADSQRTLASELRGIDQSNMTGMQLWKDKKKEAEEYKASAIAAAKQATAAFEAGDKTAGDKYAGLSEDYFKQAATAAKQLNVEVTADTTALNNLVTAQERAITRLESARTQTELRGGNTSGYDAAIAKQEKVLQVYKATQASAEATVLQSKERSSALTKQSIIDITNTSIAAQKQMQDAQLAGMNKVQEAANQANGGQPTDLTTGMDASKAQFIKDWAAAKDAVVKDLSSATDGVTVEMMRQIRERVQLPSEDWNNSIFGMKGMFVQSVDEMSKKLEADLFKGLDPSVMQEKMNKLKEVGTQVVAASPITFETSDAMGKLDALQAKILELKSDGVTLAEDKTISKLQDLMTVYLGDLKKANESAGKSNEELFKKYSESREAAFEATMKSIDSVYSKMSDLVNKDWTINVEVSGSGSSLVGKKLGGLISGYQNGGLLQALANGGSVRNVLHGAYLPGFGGGDRRLLYGEDGEVMLNKYSVRSGGLDTALAYNSGDFRTVISNLSERVGGQTSQSSVETVIWKFTDTGESAKIQGTPTDIRIIQKNLRRMERLRS